jgi:hypothetical protein
VVSVEHIPEVESNGNGEDAGDSDNGDEAPDLGGDTDEESG